MTAPARLQGRIKFFKSTEGYGMIADDHGGQDAFLHKEVCKAAGVDNAYPGMAVEYEYMVRRGRGRRATWIRVKEDV